MGERKEKAPNDSPKYPQRWKEMTNISLKKTATQNKNYYCNKINMSTKITA